MTKQLSPLQKFIELRTNLQKLGISSSYYDAIETALKEHELLTKAKIVITDKKISDDDIEKLKCEGMIVDTLEQCEIKPLFDEKTLKKLKAFEICEEKFVNITILMGCENLEEYNKHPLTMRKGRLSQEEFDLLKEELK